MSLTSYLDDPTSPLRQFLTERFPRTSSLYKLCKLPPGPVQTMRPTNAEGCPWGRIAMALDYRIRYYFPSVASERLAAYKGADGLLPKKVIRSFFTSLEHDILLSIRPVRRRLEQVQEEMLARYCVVLSLFEELYRNPRRSIEHSSLFVPKPKRNLEDLLAIAQPHWIEDLCQLSWAFHDRCADLFLCKRMESNPSFEGSVDVDGADADLIVDRCLIELKTTVKRKREWSVWIRQLLGYVLLDYSNQHQIEAVAIYLARQGVLLRWPLSELLGMLSTDGCEPVLKDLRTALRRVLIARR